MTEQITQAESPEPTRMQRRAEQRVTRIDAEIAQHRTAMDDSLARGRMQEALDHHGPMARLIAERELLQTFTYDHDLALTGLHWALCGNGSDIARTQIRQQAAMIVLMNHEHLLTESDLRTVISGRMTS